MNTIQESLRAPLWPSKYDDGEYDGQLRGTVYTEDEHLFNPFYELGAVYEKGGMGAPHAEAHDG